MTTWCGFSAKRYPEIWDAHRSAASCSHKERLHRGLGKLLIE